MIITTTQEVPGREIAEVKGIARGSTVRSRMFVFDIFSAFRSIIGGELDEYTRLQADAREQAIERMMADAEEMGADAIVSIRFESATLMQGASELYVYGTAVTLK